MQVTRRCGKGQSSLCGATAVFAQQKVITSSSTVDKQHGNEA